MAYSRGAVERAMKVQEVILRAIDGKLTWVQAADILGYSPRTIRRIRWRLRTHGPSTYKIPGSRDVPPVFNVHILDDAPNRAETIFRSKAVGEPPLMLAISVWLAIADAIGSIGPPGGEVKLDAPATPERVLKAIEARLGSAPQAYPGAAWRALMPA